MGVEGVVGKTRKLQPHLHCGKLVPGRGRLEEGALPW